MGARLVGRTRTPMGGRLLALALVAPCAAFYLPGVAPRDYMPSEKVDLKVNKLTSTKTQCADTAAADAAVELPALPCVPVSRAASSGAADRRRTPPFPGNPLVCATAL